MLSTEHEPRWLRPEAGARGPQLTLVWVGSRGVSPSQERSVCGIAPTRCDPWGNLLSAESPFPPPRRADQDLWLLPATCRARAPSRHALPAVHQGSILQERHASAASSGRHLRIQRRGGPVSRFFLAFYPPFPASGFCRALSTKKLQRFGKQGRKIHPVPVPAEQPLPASAT